MKLKKQNSETIQVEFTLEEYYRIKHWLIGKDVGKIDIQTHDALEGFISISAWINPDIDIELDNKFSNNFQEIPLSEE